MRKNNAWNVFWINCFGLWIHHIVLSIVFRDRTTLSQFFFQKFPHFYSEFKLNVYWFWHFIQEYKWELCESNNNQNVTNTSNLTNWYTHCSKRVYDDDNLSQMLEWKTLWISTYRLVFINTIECNDWTEI